MMRFRIFRSLLSHLAHPALTLSHRSLMEDYSIFNAGNVVLQSGITFRDAKLAYKTHGRLAADKSNAIIYMTSFSAHHYDVDWMIGPGKALDTDRYFVIATNLFGNG